MASGMMMKNVSSPPTERSSLSVLAAVKHLFILVKMKHLCFVWLWNSIKDDVKRGIQFISLCVFNGSWKSLFSFSYTFKKSMGERGGSLFFCCYVSYREMRSRRDYVYTFKIVFCIFVEYCAKLFAINW